MRIYVRVLVVGVLRECEYSQPVLNHHVSMLEPHVWKEWHERVSIHDVSSWGVV